MIQGAFPVDITQCAPAVLTAALSRDQAEILGSVLKAIAEPTRLQIVSPIKSQPAKQACECDLADSISVSQPTISQRLKIVHEAGLIDQEKRGTWTWCSINTPQWSTLAELLR